MVLHAKNKKRCNKIISVLGNGLCMYSKTELRENIWRCQSMQLL